MSAAYYNEIDPYAAQWLRNLIAAGHIAAGDVDERSITEVRPDDLRGYTQCHFFAGIGVWSYALRLAGWPDDRPIWTGSCPCQPFSAAGKGEGAADARHLWPEWFRFIRECRPVRIVGEQVGAAIRHGWLDLVSADLEGVGYAVGAAVVGAHSVGAPHIRQRLFFVADSYTGGERVESASNSEIHHRLARDTRIRLGGGSQNGELADPDGGNAGAEGLQRSGEHGQQPEDGGAGVALGYAIGARLEEQRGERGTPYSTSAANSRQAFIGAGASVSTMEQPSGQRRERREAPAPGHVNDQQASERPEGEHGPGIAGSHWSACDWLPCIDGKARPVEPGTFPLAHGATARVGRLRAYGNAIVAPLAAEFIGAYMGIRPNSYTDKQEER